MLISILDVGLYSFVFRTIGPKLRIIYTVEAPVSGHPQEAESVFVTGAGRYGDDSCKKEI